MRKIRGVLALVIAALNLVLGALALSDGIVFNGAIMVVIAVALAVCGMLELRGFDWGRFRRVP